MKPPGWGGGGGPWAPIPGCLRAWSIYTPQPGHLGGGLGSELRVACWCLALVDTAAPGVGGASGDGPLACVCSGDLISPLSFLL